MKGCRNGVGIVFNTKLTLSCATRVVTSLTQEKYEIAPRPPLPVIFGKNSKNFISKFSGRRSRDKVPMHKTKIVEKVHIRYTRKNFSPIG